MRRGAALIAIYARTAADDARGTGCRGQALLVRRRAGLVADGVRVYADAARSGLDPDRPQLRRLLEDARSGRVRRVLVSDLSRLARDASRLSAILEKLEAASAEVEAVEQEPFDV